MLLKITEQEKVIHMENTQGFFVDLLLTGASIYRVGVPDHHGNQSNIAMALKMPGRYNNDPSYAGATLGPVSGRIPGGLLSINGQLHRLSQNEGSHHLHGGFQSVSRTDWQILTAENKPSEISVSFGIKLPDKFEGYPGNRILQTTYRLTAHNCLEIIYEGQTDADTYFNLSNHCYWNLSGDFSQSALTHHLKIIAQSVWLNDDKHIPVELCLVRGTPYDFTSPRLIDPAKQENNESLSKGYNNAYLLDDTTAVILDDPQSGRRLILETNYPVVQFYSGGYLDHRTIMEGNITAAAGCALAFEPQEKPVLNTVPPFIAHPDLKWERKIRYTFFWDQ